MITASQTEIKIIEWCFKVSSAMTTVLPGRYRHYKGQEYSVLGVARHSETEEELVVYRQEYGDRDWWVRPKQMFLEIVVLDGREVPRFQFLGPSDAGSETK
jgi:hypothetical protein